MLDGFKRAGRAIVLCMAAPLLVACATSGPLYSQIHASEPALAADAGRIYLYRKGELTGSAVQPSIKINGVVVGSAVPGGYFYVDEPAGDYEISTTTEVKEDVKTTLKAGEFRFVRFDISLGFLVGHVAPTVVWPEQGQSEIAELHFIGTKQ